MIDNIQKDVQDFYNFKASGLTDYLSDADKKKISETFEKLTHLYEKLNKNIAELDELNKVPTKTFSTAKNQTFTRNIIATDLDYTLEQKAKIFSHGKTNYNIWFLNRRKYLCLVKSAYIAQNKTIYLKVLINVNIKNPTITQMSLDRFLYLVQVGDFVIKNEHFNSYYMKPYLKSNYYINKKQQLEEQISIIKQDIDDIKFSPFYQSMNKLYRRKEKELKDSYNIIVDGIKATQPANMVNVIADDEVKTKKIRKAIEHDAFIIQNVWNSTLTAKQKAYFIGWLCKHIRRITVKVLDGGVSDTLMNKAYPDEFYGTKYKEKATSKGWDAASGSISFDDVADAPEDVVKILKLLCSKQTIKKPLFKGNRLSNLGLTLFILNIGHKYGLVSGKKLKENDLYYNNFRNILTEVDSIDSGYYNNDKINCAKFIDKN